MKISLKCAALLLAFLFLFSGLLSGSTPVFPAAASPNLQVPPSASTPAASTAGEFTAPPSTVEASAPSSALPSVPEASVPSTAERPEAHLTATHAFAYRCSDQTYLFCKGSAQDRIYPASITKLFSAWVAHQYLNAYQPISVGAALYTTPFDSSVAHLNYGDVLTAGQLIYGMLLPSGGDASRVLAAAAGRVIAENPSLSDKQAMAAFMEEVNHQAAAVGMSGTHFVTPDGYHHPDHYTTVSDLLILARLSLDDPLIRKIVSTPEYTLKLPDRSITWQNTNLLLHESSRHGDFYRETAIGLKTGYTDAAGRCLLAAFEEDGDIFLAGVFGCPDPEKRFVVLFENMCSLYDAYIKPQKAPCSCKAPFLIPVQTHRYTADSRCPFRRSALHGCPAR